MRAKQDEVSKITIDLRDETVRIEFWDGEIEEFPLNCCLIVAEEKGLSGMVHEFLFGWQEEIVDSVSSLVDAGTEGGFLMSEGVNRATSEMPTPIPLLTGRIH